MATAEKKISLMQILAKRGGCNRCRNDFYNQGSNSNAGHCWSLPNAKWVYRWAIGMQTPMDRRENFRRVKVYDCFHGEGPYRDVYLKRLPAHLGGAWADKREQREEEGKVS